MSVYNSNSLQSYNIFYNPITFERFPEEVLNLVEEKKIIKELSINDKALEIFKKFENISIFIDHKKFINLNKVKLEKLNYELSDFYKENISLENRIKIDKVDGKQIFSKSKNEFINDSLNENKFYILNEIEKLLLCDDNNIKYMLNYIILGGLSLVIPEIKEQYPDFCFAFNE